MEYKAIGYVIKGPRGRALKSTVSESITRSWQKLYVYKGLDRKAAKKKGYTIDKVWVQKPEEMRLL